MKKTQEIRSIDFTKILDPYSDKWIALSEDEKKIVGSGISAKEALEEAKRKNVKTPILTKVPKDYGSYIL